MSELWTPVKAGGQVGDGLSETDIPADAEHIKGWHKSKAEGVQIFGLDGTYWVLYSVTGRICAITDHQSLQAAKEQAEEFKSE